MSHRLSALLLLALGFALPAWPAAQAQQGVFVTTSGDAVSLGRAAGMLSGPPVTRALLDRYAEVLELDVAQRDAAGALLEGMQAEHAEAVRAFREESERARESFRQTQDPSVFRAVGRAGDALRTETDRLEDRYLADLRVLLTPEQDARWESAMRLHRRLTRLPLGTISGEAVDLAEIVAGLDLPADQRHAAEREVAEWEVEIDRALVEREKARSAQREVMGADPERTDPEKFGSALEAVREAQVRVRDTTARRARLLAESLEGSARAALEERVRQASFPRVYRESHVERVLRSALALEDLTPDQRAQLVEMEERFARESAAARRKWADAIAEMESKEGGPILFRGGGMMVLRQGSVPGAGEPAEPSAEERAARAWSDLQDRTLDAVLRGLTEAQRTRLPEKPAEDASSGRAVITIMPGGTP